MVLLDLAKSFLANVPPDAAVADFTMGNGHDTAFLCGLVPQGRVYAFDIQPQALENTRLLLAEKGYANATLILDGHEHAKQYIHEPIAAGMFNLGYRRAAITPCIRIRKQRSRRLWMPWSFCRRAGCW